jgi:cellulose synthase/poly-beta-1,6-N-acetylglucosamine synthase-like glycosyltransferase
MGINLCGFAYIESSKLAACQHRMMLSFLFFFSLFLLFYSYIGYGILLYLIVRTREFFHVKNKYNGEQHTLFEPEITLIVAAYNESGFIQQKIRNSLELSYPAGRLRWIFVTDGSTDDTPEIVSRYSQITLVHQPARKGKNDALNRAMHLVNTPYVIFSDANTLLNPEAVKEIVKHYADSRVGGVAGEKKILKSKEDLAVASGEGLYWEYESLLKKLDSSLYSVVGAAGELFSMKASLYQENADNIIIEDFVQSLQICQKGYVVRYEPNAYAMESASISMKEEQKRKIRIAAGAFQAMQKLKSLFNVVKYPILSFQYISHRILRWTLCPLCLIICYITNTLLVIDHKGRFYGVFFWLQTVFYAMALIGWIFAGRRVKMKVFFIPYYLLFMNLSVILGFYRYIRKRQTVMWEKAER